MEKVIAKKSYLELISSFIGIILFTYMFLIIKKIDYVFLVFDILSFLNLIKEIFRFLLLSNDIIVKKSDSLILYPNSYKKRNINISNIYSAALTKNVIIINTSEGGIEIRFIHNKKEVVKRINKIVEEYNRLK